MLMSIGSKCNYYQNDCFKLLKLNNEGEVLWNYEAEEEGVTLNPGIGIKPIQFQGFYYVPVSRWSVPGDSRAYLFRVDSNGNEMRQLFNWEESDYIQKQATSLANPNNSSPRIESTKKQLEQIELQAESLSQRASLHKYLADEGVYPKQSALQSAYEAASAVKQSEALAAQLKAEKSELQERAVEDLPKLRESRRATQANLRRFEATQQELLSNKSQIQEAQKQLDIYNKQKDQLVLKAPIDGSVLTLKTDLLLGQNFNKGDTIAVIGNLSRVSITLQLPEEDRAYVKKGQTVTARIRALQDEVFKGSVDEIAPVTSETGKETSLRRIWDIDMVLDNPQGTLRPGMTGYAKIDTGHWRPMLLLAWDEVYKSFRLDRYIDRNPLAFLSPKGNIE
jgi:biotin carboxyl carrier protein